MNKLVRSNLVWLARHFLGILHTAECEEIRSRLKSCGRNVELHYPLCVANAECVSLGNRVSLAPYVHIWGLGGVHMEDRVMIGSHTAITTLTHDYQTEPMHNTLLKRPVLIEEGV